jgi:hypothetical protein
VASSGEAPRQHEGCGDFGDHDVLTTGATLEELARVLRRAGAASVAGWVVARTL